MPTLLQQLQAIVRPAFQNTRFDGIDPAHLNLPAGTIIHPDVAEYLSTCIPDDYLPIYVYEPYEMSGAGVEKVWISYELTAAADLLFINSPAGSRYSTHGFLEIGSDNGNALAFDIRHGTLFRFDPCDPFVEGRDCRNAPQRRMESPFDGEGIRKFAPIRYDSFQSFCRAAQAASEFDATAT